MNVISLVWVLDILGKSLLVKIFLGDKLIAQGKIEDTYQMFNIVFKLLEIMTYTSGEVLKSI